MSASERYVTSLYNNVLGRDPDVGGLKFWAGLLDSDMLTPAEVAGAFFDAVEFSNSVSPIARLYLSALGRVPDADGLNFWVDMYRGGEPLDDIAGMFLDSAEFAARFGDVSDNEVFITALYTNVLGRAPDEEGLEFWVNELNYMSREDVLLAFSDSAENVANTEASTNIILAYQGILERAPTPAEFDAALLMNFNDLLVDLTVPQEYTVAEALAIGVDNLPPLFAIIDDADAIFTGSGVADEALPLVSAAWDVQVTDEITPAQAAALFDIAQNSGYSVVGDPSDFFLPDGNLRPNLIAALANADEITVTASLDRAQESAILALQGPQGGPEIHFTDPLSTDPYGLTVADVEVTEGDAGQTLMTFTLHLDRVATDYLTVQYETTGGTATPNDDYVPLGGVVNFVPGQSVATVTVEVLGDHDYEPNETVQLHFTGVSLASDETATGTIVNDDEPLYTLSVSSPEITEPDVGTKDMTFQLTLDRAPTQAVTVSYLTTDAGTATPGDDFTAIAGTVTFAAGQQVAAVTVKVLGDTKFEDDETVGISFYGPALENAPNLADPLEVTGTILNDDDPLYNLTVSTPTISEPDTGTKAMTFQLMLDQAPTQALTVSYTTTNTGTATPGDDFEIAAGSVTFAAGQQVATVTVLVYGDTQVEQNETVDILFYGPALDNAPNLGEALKVSGTILDNEVAQTFILTTGIDAGPDFVGTPYNDRYISTGLTLQSADELDGAEGYDTLVMSVDQPGVKFAASPTLTSIEHIVVRAPNVFMPSIEFDLSNADGYQVLESNEVSAYDQWNVQNGLVGFYDIQDANNTALRIIDTGVDHEYSYDIDAFRSVGQGPAVAGPGPVLVNDDIAQLYLQEVGKFGYQDGPVVTFSIDAPYEPGRSLFDEIHIESDDWNGITATLGNYLDDLNVGQFLNKVVITGDASLEIEKFLDDNVNVVDARELDGNLTLDLKGQGSVRDDGRPGDRPNEWAEEDLDAARDNHRAELVAPMIILGAKGDDRINVNAFAATDRDVLPGANGVAALGTGNDVLNVGFNPWDGNDDLESIHHRHFDWSPSGFGNWTVDAGANDDRITLNLSGVQNVDLGTGNDRLVINGDVLNLDGRIFDHRFPPTPDPESTIRAGEGNDTVEIDGDGDYDIDLGDGNNWLEMEGRGDRNIESGSGRDRIEIEGNGDNTIVTDGGNDSVEIKGRGDNQIWLGDGNDELSIEHDGGPHRHEEDLDEAGWPRTYDTFVDGGTGNDTIRLDGDGPVTIVAGYGSDRVYVEGDGEHRIIADMDSPTMAITGGDVDGNDRIYIEGKGNNIVTLGGGNDLLEIDHGRYGRRDATELAALGATAFTTYVEAGSGNDTVRIEGEGAVTVHGGEGDNEVSIDHGHHATEAYTSLVTGGSGKDKVFIQGNGDATIDVDGGDDSVVILGNGVHSIALGEGNNGLLIIGDGDPNDVTGRVTTITSGSGMDEVAVLGAHRLDADLDGGDDAIMLRTRNLSEGDTVNGGEGTDTMILTNPSGEIGDGLVATTETKNVSSFEVFDLRDNNIELWLTDRLFGSAEGNQITVVTGNSSWLSGAESAEEAEAAEIEAMHHGWSYQPAVQTVDLTTVDADDIDDYAFYLQGGNKVRDVIVVNDEQLDGLFMDLQFGDAWFQRFPYREGEDSNPSGNFDPFYEDDSLMYGVAAQDTLRVKAQTADVTAADLQHTTGLERIEFHTLGEANWSLQLTDAVIDQTTDIDSLIVHVDRMAPNGRLDIDTTLVTNVVDSSSPSVWNGTTWVTNGVVIEKTKNVEVYIDGDLVTEDEVRTGTGPGEEGVNFGTAARPIYVVNQLYFTPYDGDDLQGDLFFTGTADTFYADKIIDIQSADKADGKDGMDTLRLFFGTGNALGAVDLATRFSNADIQNIERLIWDTGDYVWFEGFGAGYLADLQYMKSGESSDVLTKMRKGLEYDLGGGNDRITFAAIGEDALSTGDTTIDGGKGNDSVVGTSEDDTFYLKGVEDIDGGDSTDHDVAILLSNRSDAPNDLISFYDVEEIYGTNWDDNIFANAADGDVLVSGRGGDDSIVVGVNIPDDVTVYGGEGDDTITVNAKESALVAGDADMEPVMAHRDRPSYDDVITVTAPEATVLGNQGDDSILVIASDEAVVLGGADDDTINVGDSTVNASDVVLVLGDAQNASIAGYQPSEPLSDVGRDSITVFANHAAVVMGDDGDISGVIQTVDPEHWHPRTLVHDVIQVTVTAAEGWTDIDVQGDDTPEAGTGPVVVAGEQYSDDIDVAVTVEGGASIGLIDVLVHGDYLTGAGWTALRHRPTLGDEIGDDTIRVNVLGDAANGAGVMVLGDGGKDDIDVTVSAADGQPAPVFAIVHGDGDASGEDDDDSIDVDVSGGNAWVYGGGGDDDITVSADQVTVGAGSVGAELFFFPTAGAAYVEGNDGNDDIDVTAVFATVYGDDPWSFWPGSMTAAATVPTNDDTINVTVSASAYVDGGEGNDVITVTATGPGASVTILGGSGDDQIAVVGAPFPVFPPTSSVIEGGAGNDNIVLSGNLRGVDLLRFGNIAYTGTQTEWINTQGLDAITDFAFESWQLGGDPIPGPQDWMDFSDFLGWPFSFFGAPISQENLVTNPGNWEAGDVVQANTNLGNAIVVLSTQGLKLTREDFSVDGTGIQLNNNAKAVVVVGQDGTLNGSNIKTFDIYYVTDVDSGPGQTWKVEQVATVTGATEVGVESVMDNLLADLRITDIALDVVSAAENGFTVLAQDFAVNGPPVLNLVNPGFPFWQTIQTLANGAEDGTTTNVPVDEQGSLLVQQLWVQDGELNRADSGYSLVQGTSGGENLSTSTVTNTVNIGDRNALIYGFGGNDVIRGGHGADYLFGGDDDDKFVVVGALGAEYLPTGMWGTYLGDEGIASVVTENELETASVDSDAAAGEVVQGGDGYDVLYAFGTVDFTGVNDGGDLGVEELVSHSDITMTRAQLLSLELMTLEPFAPHKLTITDLLPGESQQDVFEDWLNQAGQQLETNFDNIEVGGVVYRPNDIAQFADEVGAFDVGDSYQSLDADWAASYRVQFYGEFANNNDNFIQNFSSGDDVDDDILDFSALGAGRFSGMEHGSGGTDGGPFSGSIDPFLFLSNSGNNDDGNANLNGRVALVYTDEPEERGQIYEMFDNVGDDAFSMAANGEGILIAGSNADDSDLYVWYINDADGNGNISNDTTEIQLVGIMSDTSDGIDGFNAANFTF